MSSVVIAGDTSGTVTLSAPAVSGTTTLTLPATTDTLVGKTTTDTLTNKTLTSPTISGTPVMSASVITSGTAVASTSGTSIDFTSIPSWVKRITVMLGAVSTNGASLHQVQLGTSAGVQTTGYVSGAFTNGASNTSTTGFLTTWRGDASQSVSGALVLTLLNSSTNAWVAQGNGSTVASDGSSLAGTKTLSATLDRVRLTTVNGTDTFDAGSINILYE